MEEIWKDIEGFEGLYEVSSQGRVRSLERTETIRNRWGQVAERKYKERILRPHMSMGYLTVDLAHGGKISKKRIHRLMAEAFIPGGSADLEVNHINEDRTDNRLENLEWVTHRGNAIHGTAVERGRQHRPLLWEKAVAQLSMEGDEIARYPSLKAAARAVGGDATCIQRVCDGRSKHHHGYRWRWAE